MQESTENKQKSLSFNKNPVSNLYPLTREKTRILRPCEYKLLYNAIPKKDYKTLLNALLLTGMRYVEMQRFQQHPKWFDGEFIHLPEEAEKKITKVSKKEKYTPEEIENLKSILGEKKVKIMLKGRKPRTHQGRDVRLSSVGKTVVSYFVDVEIKLPCWQTWNDNLCRWAEKGGLNSVNIGVKSTRKTWESWLLAIYPVRITEITLSQGHNSTISIKHYLNVAFTREDKRDMKDYVEGWIE